VGVSPTLDAKLLTCVVESVASVWLGLSILGPLL
jgi:hypothetical protein